MFNRRVLFSILIMGSCRFIPQTLTNCDMELQKYPFLTLTYNKTIYALCCYHKIVWTRIMKEKEMK